MWYFVRRWAEVETAGSGQAWPFPVVWQAKQDGVKWDAQIGTYAKTVAAAELSKQPQPTYWTLRWLVEVWVWNGKQWNLAATQYTSRFRPPTGAQQWTSMFPLGQRYARIASSGAGRWKTVPGTWGATAGSVWSAEMFG